MREGLTTDTGHTCEIDDVGCCELAIACLQQSIMFHLAFIQSDLQ